MIEEILKTTGTILVPTHSHYPSHTALPTVVPSHPYVEKVGATGAKTLWVVTIVMAISSVVFAFRAWQTPVSKRLFHVLTTFITVFATISYFAMATGDGNSFAHTAVHHKHKHTPDVTDHVYRQVFWARYADWAVTTPLLLLDLAFLAGLNGANILVAVIADILMIALGLFAAYGHNEGQKWGYYGFSCLAFLVIIYQLAIPGRKAVAARDGKTAKTFTAIAGFTIVIWTLYPIVWAIGDGARLWSVDAEIIAYAILDILAKPVFGTWLLRAHGNNAGAIDGFWSHGLQSEGGLRLEDGN
jgi:bacteriorhodopsin